MSESCSIFCKSHQNSLTVSNCDGLEADFASLCSCSDAPVANTLACLRDICSSVELEDLVASEESRCGAAAASAIATTPALTRTIIVTASEPARITVTVENSPAPSDASSHSSGSTLSSESTTATFTTSTLNMTVPITSPPAPSSTPPLASIGAATAGTHSHTSLVLVVALPLILVTASAVAFAFLRRLARGRRRTRKFDLQVHSLPTPASTLSDTIVSPRKGSDSYVPPRRPSEPTAPQRDIPTLSETDAHLEHLHTSVRSTPAQRFHPSLDFADVRTTSLAAGLHPPPMDTIISPRRDTDDAQPPSRGETPMDERVMVLPWPLGERLLALLTNRPAQRPMDGSVSGSEPLPPYEEHDARRA